jgi:hypothetical protein
MLLWEMLTRPVVREANGGGAIGQTVPVMMRLPYDTRCCVITKSGKRCRGRICKGSDYCPLHDPAVVERREQGSAVARAKRRNRLVYLPDGYLRKLTKRAAVGNAMDRLYREIRLGIITPEMGGVLFGILTRLMDSGLLDGGRVVNPANSRSRADRLRPKMKELLTRAERAAWQKAIAGAPPSVVAQHSGRRAPVERPVKVPLQAAS